MASDQLKPLANLQRPTRRRYVILGLAAGVSWFLYLHRYTWNFIRPELKEEYGFSNTQLETIYTLFNVPYAFGQIPSGIVCDLFGPHLFLVVIIIIWSLLLPSVGLTGNFYGLGAFRVLFGAAQAGAYPSLSKVTKTWFPLSSRTVVQGFIASFSGRFGGFMASIIMGAVLMGMLDLSWRQALVVLAASGLVFALVFGLLYRNRPEDDLRVNEQEIKLIRAGDPISEKGPPVLPFSRVFRSSTMRMFVLQQMMSAGADFVYLSVTVSYFKEVFGAENTQTGLMVSLPLLGGAIGGTFGGLMNDVLIRRTGSRRWSRTAVGFAGKALACGFMFVAIQQTSMLAAGISLFVVKFFSDWSQPTVWGTCTDLGGRYSATVFSVINTAGGIGGIVTPIAGGLILDYYTREVTINGLAQTVTDYNPLFVVVAVMYLVSASCWFGIDCTKTLDRE